MLPSQLLVSFRTELEKEASYRDIRVNPTMGAVGATVAGAWTLSKLIEDFKQDQLLYDMGQMPPEVYKKRIRRKLLTIGAMSAAGGAVGTASPELAARASKMLQGKLKELGGAAAQSGAQAAEAGAQFATRAGRAFAEGAVDVGREAASDIGQRFAEGVRKTLRRP